MTATVEGLDKLKAKFRGMPIKTQVAAKRALDTGADDLIAMQKRLVPVEEGDLRDSIRKEKGRTHLSVNVAAGGAKTTRAVRAGVKAFYDYALAQEFGTTEMPANPFFWPAYRIKRRAIRARISREIRKALKET